MEERGADQNEPTVVLGFPNAGLEGPDNPLDLNKLVVKNPASTFFMRVESNQYEQLGINQDDILVIDRSAMLKQGALIVAVADGEFTVLEVSKKSSSKIDTWGVITYIIKSAE